MVTLEKLKNYLKVDNTDCDDTLQMLLDAAVRKTQDYCSTYWEETLVTETRVGDGKTVLHLYRLPVVEVDSVLINGELVEDYTERLSIGRLYRAWPSGAEITVTYSAGFAAYGEDIPPEAEAAIYQTVAAWYNNPTGVQNENVSGVGSVTYDISYELPLEVKQKLASLRQRVL